MDTNNLSVARQRRLEELRAKYPKPVPPRCPTPHKAFVNLSLRFEFTTFTQEEADKAAFDWMWHMDSAITRFLLSRYGKDGLREVSAWIRARGYSAKAGESTIEDEEPMISWLNELYELTQIEAAGLPWDSVAVIGREYERLLDYVQQHYTLTLTTDGWIATPKPNWRETCAECGSIYVVDGVKCGMCADGL